MRRASHSSGRRRGTRVAEKAPTGAPAKRCEIPHSHDTRVPPLDVNTTGQGRARFPKKLRVTRRRDFERVFAHGRRAGNAFMRVWVVPNGLDHPRVGVAVGRRQGGAVQRNRLKRIVREAARLSMSEFPPGLDIICAPRPSPMLTLRKCRASLVRLARQAARSAEGPQEPVH